MTNNFVNLLPDIFKADETIQRISSILDSELNEIEALIEKILVYPCINQLHEEQLEELALSLHITKYDGWLFADTLEAKRNFISRAIALHKHKGTVQSIKDIFYTLGIDATLSEWFDYEGGKPYSFKINLTLNEIVNIVKLGDLYRLVDNIKPVRCRLDGIISELNTYGKIYLGAANYTTNIITVGGKL